MEAREEDDVEKDLATDIPGRFARDESAGVVFAEGPMIGVGGKASSTNTPAGVEE